MTEAGPVPHEPEAGKVVTFGPGASTAAEIASGARLLVDVEFGRGRKLYALSQGEWNGQFEGSPALDNTGQLLEVNQDGSMTVLADGLDRPTSLELIGTTAYVVTLTGEILRFDGVASAPFGHAYGAN
jgi:hypothetical protein